MPDDRSQDLTETLERLNLAIADAQAAEQRALARIASADARTLASGERDGHADTRSGDADSRTVASDARHGIADVRSVAAAARAGTAHARHDAADERNGPSDERDGIADVRDGSSDRRDDVADARDDIADTRDGRSDLRDDAADARDDLADARDGASDVRDDLADVRDRASSARMEAADRQSQTAMDDSDEYQRALHHYQQLMRHRIANPLHVIVGMAETLLREDDLAPGTQRLMLQAIADQGHLLERLTLFEPEQQDTVERDLHAKPFE
ncbi:MAG: hypothetical protein JWM98_2633 [Thermoleophilia bacterium]|nr:hypothetical protein [Thermoleophilia bacterium]